MIATFAFGGQYSWPVSGYNAECKMPPGWERTRADVPFSSFAFFYGIFYARTLFASRIERDGAIDG